MQFCNYQSHKSFVRSGKNETLNPETKSWLFKEDVLVYFSIIYFTVGVSLSGVIYFSIANHKGYFG